MNLDLTTGTIGKALVRFSLPMIAGNLLQQVYHIVDTIIVGKVLGSAALVAVGSSYSVMILLTSVVLGLCMGSGVVFAQAYGAKEYDRMKAAVFNAFVLVLGTSLLINMLSFLLIGRMMAWLSIPPEAVALTETYLRIIIFGMIFVTVYHFFASALRSVGNTLLPLVFLGISALTNVVLDLIFVLGFGWGVSGAAWATVFAQALSAVLISLYFVTKQPELCPQKRHLRFQCRLVSVVFQQSALTALQQSVMNLGILMVQGLVNSFGSAAGAAFAVAVKIDALAYLPAQDFGNAFSTYVAQNYGAGKGERIQKGAVTALKISVCFCVVVSLFVCLFARPLLLFFIDATETETLRIGASYLRIVGASYVGIGILFLLYGFYRGISRPMMSVVLTVLSLGTRVLLAYSLAGIPTVGLQGVWFSIPIGWVLADVFGIWMWYHKRKAWR